MKIKKYLTYIIIFILLGSFIIFKYIDNKIISTNAEPQKILFFGDSITFGAGATLNQGYSYLLNDRLKIKCITKGIPSSKLTESLDRIETDVIAYKPSYVLILYGTNDVAENIKPNDFKNAYISVIEKIKKSLPKTDIFVCSLTPRIGDDKIIYFKDYQKIIEDIAREEKLSFIDTNKAITYNDLNDHVHPNDIGHRKLAEFIYNKISMYINQQ